MARASSFSVRYVAGMAALMLVAGVLGLVLTDERRAGTAGTLEIVALLLGAVLFAVAAIRAKATPGTWPLLCAVAGIITVAVLAFLSLSESSPALIFEIGALVLGFLAVLELRKRVTADA